MTETMRAHLSHDIAIYELSSVKKPDNPGTFHLLDT